MTIFDQYNYSTIEQSIAKTTETSRKLLAPKTASNDSLHKACVDFEAIFVKQMLNVMRKTVTKSGLLDGGHAEEIFEDLLYDEYAQKMAQTGSFGLAEMIYDRLSNQL